MADIQNMLMYVENQVNVCSKDIDAMRFVWRDNQKQLINNFGMLVHIFKRIDLPFSPNWVLRKSALNCEDYIQQC